jgi:hypothetical protein
MTDWDEVRGRPMYYGLNGEPLTLRQWADLLGSNKRRVALDALTWGTVSAMRISTVYLGIDHNFLLTGPPLIFETMVFGEEGWADEACYRWSTLDEAQRGHEKVVLDLIALIESMGGGPITRITLTEDANDHP